MVLWWATSYAERTRCLYGWIMYVGCSSTKKVNLLFSNENTMISSLMRTQWPIFIELGMWAVLGTTHVVCRHRMFIFNTPFVYLFWLANNKKDKYSEFCLGYSDKIWYVESGGHKCHPHGLLSLNAHNYLILYLTYIPVSSDQLKDSFQKHLFLTTRRTFQQCWFLTARDIFFINTDSWPPKENFSTMLISNCQKDIFINTWFWLSEGHFHHANGDARNPTIWPTYRVCKPQCEVAEMG